MNMFFMVMLKHLYHGSSPSFIIWDTVFGTVSDWKVDHDELNHSVTLQIHVDMDSLLSREQMEI